MFTHDNLLDHTRACAHTRFFFIRTFHHFYVGSMLLTSQHPLAPSRTAFLCQVVIYDVYSPPLRSSFPSPSLHIHHPLLFSLRSHKHKTWIYDKLIKYWIHGNKRIPVKRIIWVCFRYDLTRDRTFVRRQELYEVRWRDRFNDLWDYVSHCLETPTSLTTLCCKAIRQSRLSVAILRHPDVVVLPPRLRQMVLLDIDEKLFTWRSGALE